MKRRLAIFGATDLAIQVTAAAIETGEYDIFGYFEDFKPIGEIVNGYPVYGKVEDAIRLYKEGEFDCMYIAIGYYHFDVKERVYNQVKGIIPLANIIDKTAHIAPSSVLGEGIFVGYKTQIWNNCVIEDNVHINGNVIFGHDNHIGKHTYFSGGDQIAGFSNIGERCFLGISVTMGDHLKIVDDVWVGLGMIVYKSINKSGKYSVLQKIIKLE